ncbi:peptidase C1-like family-domain-containing protein [Irpex rosettiformis]|uniref:Peptidase C1-like family-domain-containing protein n=1 Tax=Irpex rosettiformis TaxID=378272 RepID=A0ACB8UFD2_9APHY|nr:peptidase C1-like family-domain-containing protein [Irpex rosettiformis]
MGASQSKSSPASESVAAPSELNEKRISNDFAKLAITSSTPASVDGTITPTQFSSWEEEIATKPQVELARTILNHTDLRATLKSRKAVITDSHVFNHELKFKTGPVTNQKSSGRCWLFATTNYYDKDGKAGRWEGTSKELYEIAKGDYSPADSFSLINDPRNDYGKLYTVDKLGNLWGGRPVLYVNTEIDNLKAAVVKQIKAGQSVFFGCDVGQFSERVDGIMDTALFDYETPFDITLGLTKADRLRVGESAMTHAMVISGVHLNAEGKPVRYKVENSWGDAAGNKGYYLMTDAWFEQFVYQVVIPKALAPKELVKVYESDDRVVLPAWDPMVGSILS